MPKLLKTYYKSKSNLLCLGSTWDESGLTVNHVTGWTFYAPCMSYSHYLLLPHWKSCVWMCLSHICIMSTLPALICLMNKCGYRTRAVLGLPSNREGQKGGLGE